MIVYLAGQIYGRLDYKKHFDAAEKKLRDMGHIVINPSTLPSGIKDYMGICKAMIDQSDAIYFMKYWKDSKGAQEEYEYALKNNIPIFHEDNIMEELLGTRIKAIKNIFKEVYLIITDIKKLPEEEFKEKLKELDDKQRFIAIKIRQYGDEE